MVNIGAPLLTICLILFEYLQRVLGLASVCLFLGGLDFNLNKCLLNMPAVCRGRINPTKIVDHQSTWQCTSLSVDLNHFSRILVYSE